MPEFNHSFLGLVQDSVLNNLHLQNVIQWIFLSQRKCCITAYIFPFLRLGVGCLLSDILNIPNVIVTAYLSVLCHQFN